MTEEIRKRFEDEDGQRITYKARWWMPIPELPKED